MNCRILEENGSIGIALNDGRRFSLNSVQGTLHAEPFKNGVKITVSGENPEWSFSPADTEVPYRWRMMVYPTFYSILNVDCGWHPTEENDCFFGALSHNESHYHTVLYSKQQKLAVCAMFPGPVKRGGVFRFEDGNLFCRMEPGDSAPDACYLFFDENASASLDHIAEESAKMPVTDRAGEGFLGWNSWDYYLSQISEEILFDELRKMRDDELCKDLKWFVIDEGWEDHIGDWNPNEKFPSGLEVMAQRITSAGFRPGIWTSPFMVSVESRVFKEKPEMFVKNASGEFITNNFGPMGVLAVLNPCTPEGEQFIRDLYRRLKAAGFEYFKIDFITVLGSKNGIYPGNEPLSFVVNHGLELIREAIGEDSYLLGCGMPPGSGFGIVDSMRICPDISTYWSCILASARSLSMYSMFHNRNWINDPDFLIVRNKKTSLEEKFNLKEFKFVPYIPFTTRTGKEIDSLNEVEVWCALVILSGGAIFLSDKISALNEIGRRYVKTVLDYRSTIAARPLNLGDSGVPPFWLKKEPERTLFAVFNFEDEVKRFELPEEMKDGFTGMDVFRNTKVELSGSVELAPRSVLLLSNDKGEK